MKRMDKFLMVVALAGFAQTQVRAQDAAKTKGTVSRDAAKVTTMVHESKPQTFTAEKSVNGKTVQVYTQEQFDKLPRDRKEYYLSRPGTYEIINPKDK